MDEQARLLESLLCRKWCDNRKEAEKNGIYILSLHVYFLNLPIKGPEHAF
jgi:hypothetical protein